MPYQHFPAWIAHDPLLSFDFNVIARNGHSALGAAGIASGDVIPIDLFCSLGHVLCSPDGKFHGLGDVALAREGYRRQVTMSVPIFEGVLQIVATSDLIALFPRVLAEHRAQNAGISLYEPPVTILPPQLCMIWHRRHNGDPAHLRLRGIVRDILELVGKYRDASSPD